MLALFVKTTLVLVNVSIATALMRRSSAASRHVVWTSGLLAVLFLPLAIALLPTLPLPLLRPTIADTMLAANLVVPEVQVFEAVPAPPVPGPSRDVNHRATAAAAGSARSLPWIEILWSVGAAIVLSRTVFGLWLRSRLQRRCTLATDERIAQIAATAAAAMRIRRHVAILVAPTEMMPATWGLRRPKLLLPPSASSWTDERLRVVLIHELAHVMRFDVVSATVARAATLLAWWNPLVWFATSRAQLERERACDDTVLRAGITASSYADELVTIAQTLPSPFAHRLALAMARPNKLGARVSSILDTSRRRTGTSHTVAIATSVLLAAQWPLAAAQLVSVEMAPVRDRSSVLPFDVALIEAQAATGAPLRTGSSRSAPDVIAPRPKPPQYFEPLARMLNEREWRVPTPDFSGHWRLDGPTAPLEYQAAQSVAPFGAEFIATQDGDGLALECVPVPIYFAGRGGRGGLAQVQPVERTSIERFLFNGWATNAGGGGSIASGVAVGPDGAMRTTASRPLTSYTVRDNARWDVGVLDITTTETSQQQDYTTKIRRMRRDGDATVIETTTWSNYQPQVTTSRYVRAPLPATLNPETQSEPQPIPYGQFGAGAYRPGSGVANPYRIREVKPVYTDAALKAGLNGTVELEAIIGIDGTVTEVRVVRSLDDKLGLDENAKDVVRRTPFVPCKIGDKPVACLVVFELQFTPGPPTPIAVGQFGAGAYRPGNGVDNPVRIRAVKPQYTAEAMRAQIQGSVELEAVVGADGTVTDVRVVRSLDATLGLDASAMTTVRSTPFVPCKIKSQPVPCLVVFELQFTLDRGAADGIREFVGHWRLIGMGPIQTDVYELELTEYGTGALILPGGRRVSLASAAITKAELVFKTIGGAEEYHATVANGQLRGWHLTPAFPARQAAPAPHVGTQHRQLKHSWVGVRVS